MTYTGNVFCTFWPCPLTFWPQKERFAGRTVGPCLCQVWWSELHRFLRYRVENEKTDRQTNKRRWKPYPHDSQWQRRLMRELWGHIYTRQPVTHVHCSRWQPVTQCQMSEGNGWKCEWYLVSKFQFIRSQHQNVIIQRKNCFRFYLVVWVKPSIITQVKPNIIHRIHNIAEAQNPNPLIFSYFYVKKTLKDQLWHQLNDTAGNLLLSLFWRVWTTFRGLEIFGHDDATQWTTKQTHTSTHTYTHTHTHTYTGWCKKMG